MSLLEGLREAKHPRGDELAWRVARAINSRLGMVLRGAFYYCTLPNAVLLGILFGLLAVSPYKSPVPIWYGVMTIVVSLAGSAVAFLPFHRWRHRRRAQQLELGRSGRLVGGHAHVQKVTYRSYVLSVQLDGAVTARTVFPPSGVKSGDHIQVLYSSQCRWALGFKPSGKPFVLRVPRA